MRSSSADGALVGLARFADGLGRVLISLAEALHSEIDLQAIATRHPNTLDLPLHLIEAFINPRSSPPPVSLLLDAPWYPDNIELYKAVPKDSLIKLALFYFESTRLPNEWVKILNENFDAILAVDPFIKNISIESGINIPIFLVPQPLHLEQFFKIKRNKQLNAPFVFGHSSTFFERKNVPLLINAFERAFGNRGDVHLLLHCRLSPQHPHIASELKKLRTNRAKNIEIIHNTFSDEEYVDLFRQMDCFVSFSMGEGFSIPPREALASGIPAIVTNNTAHKTLCDTRFVRSVPANTKEAAYYDLFKCSLGEFSNCSVSDASEALLDVYNNYSFYKNRAAEAGPWLKQYSLNNIGKIYKNFFKPKKVVLSDKNMISNRTLTTNSTSLYQKYLLVQKNNLL